MSPPITIENISLDLRSRIEYQPDCSGALRFLPPGMWHALSRAPDTVVRLNVLEHIEDDRVALANIRHCLRPGGAAIILVPQGPEIFGTLDEALQHKRRYIKEELAEKMAAAGFKSGTDYRFNHQPGLVGICTAAF